MASSLEEQLSIYLEDLHALELQALEQLGRAPKVAGDAEIAEAFKVHERETERHKLYVEDRLLARAYAPGVPAKDLPAKVGGVGMALFARLQPDTPVKLVAHAYSYERLEIAAYDLLERLAHRAGDNSTVMTSRMIRRDEVAMADRLRDCFDRAVDTSLGNLDPDGVAEHLTSYLTDVHAIEQQAAKLLEQAPKQAGAQELARAFEEHLLETRNHSELIEGRLDARDAGPSTLKDAALRLGALNLGMVFKAQPDAPAKLAAFAYAFEHLEIAAYTLLARVARRVGDRETASVAEEILMQERAAAARIHGLLDVALEASLHEAGATA